MNNSRYISFIILTLSLFFGYNYFSSQIIANNQNALLNNELKKQQESNSSLLREKNVFYNENNELKNNNNSLQEENKRLKEENESLQEIKRMISYIQNRKGNVAAFTFDDGPSSITTKVLDILEENNINGTFFIIANLIENNKYDNILDRMNKNGHEIASHTYNHIYMSHHELEEVISSVRMADTTLKQYNPNLRFFRPPGFLSNEAIDNAIVNEFNYKIFYGQPTDDYLHFRKSNGVTKILTKIVKQAYYNKKLDLIFHDRLYQTPVMIESLKKSIPLLRSMNYSFVKLENL